jgi:hypothetical protein
MRSIGQNLQRLMNCINQISIELKAKDDEIFRLTALAKTKQAQIEVRDGYIAELKKELEPKNCEGCK